jgi:UDP-N-acetylglucosamine/UDP-N-acetylgalactosamine diphosphorylase
LDAAISAAPTTMSSKPPRDLVRLLNERRQGHLLPVFDVLDAEKAKRFAAQLKSVDYDLLERLVREAAEPAAAPDLGAPVEPPVVVKKGADPKKDANARRIGEELLAEGKVAALVVAGGQGSRLGHIGPKGTYPATPVKGKTLFRLFSEKLRAVETRAQRTLPFLVMTSEENHADTVAFFDANDRFGLRADQITFFPQGMLPAVDEQGRLVMREVGELFRSPNGHGGALLALKTSGALDRLTERGVEEIFYFQVDNPLVEMCDPTFLGGHRESGGDFAVKVVAKSSPDEKVGVVARRGGATCVVEYSDLPESLRYAKTADGELKFSAGNIAVHVLRTDFVRRLTEGGFSLPYHVAKKKLPIVGADGRASETTGLKFETFVFDALAFAKNPYCLEVEREREFAPIKNASGADSAESSAALQSRLSASWLDAAGAPPPRDAAGNPTVPIEISPLFADSAEALLKKSIAPPDYRRPVYLGDD